MAATEHGTYIHQVFGHQDAVLTAIMPRAVAAGLPAISVAPEVGRLLQLLATLARGERPGVVVEVGTLGGYSAIWLARGLGGGGKVVTIEADPRHAAFAAAEFKAAGVADRVEQVVAKGLEALPALAKRLGPASIDMLFLDAIKVEYAAYLAAAEPMLRDGSLVVADNALGTGSWWVTDAADPAHPQAADRAAMDTFNRKMATDPRYITTCIPMGHGVLVARRVGIKETRA